MKKAFEAWSMLLLLFSASGATIASRSIYTLESPYLPALMLSTSLLMVFIFKFRIKSSLVISICVFLLYFLLITLKFESIHLKFLVLLPLSFFIAYSYLSYFGWRFFIILEKYLTIFASFSILLWIIHIAAPNILSQSCIALSKLEVYDEIVSSHCFFYTLVSESVDSLLVRNSGFAWEPGAFAVFLCLGVVCNLLSKKFALISNFRLYILLIALLSTQSTTGYVFLLAIVAWAAWNKLNRITLAALTPVLLIFVLLVFSLPFMGEKIGRLMNEDIDTLLFTASLDWNASKMLAAQRFVSFQIDWLDFLNNPVLGYGGHDEAMWIRSTAPNVAAISGLGKLFAKFGLVGISFFLFLSYRSSKSICWHFEAKGTLFIIIFFLIIAASYSLLETPFLMCFWYAPVIALRTQKISAYPTSYESTKTTHYQRHALGGRPGAKDIATDYRPSKAN